MMTARIVVIDNDEAIRAFHTVALNGEGWEVFGYDYAHIGLAALEQVQPDLIILDFNVRDSRRSWELLQLLKMNDATANIPILITTTTFHLPAELRGYLLSRYIRVVNKPFDLDVFLPLIHKTLTLASQMGTLFSSERTLPILVVEDSEELRDALTTILGFEGYQFVSAENGLLALEALYHAEYCLILLDISMPVMGGFEFLSAYTRQLRPHTPVIILSGEDDILSRDLPSFVIDVLPKPFEISHLLRVVKKYAQPV